MKYVFNVVFLSLCVTCMAGSLHADTDHVVSVVSSEDVGQLFDGDDVLDDVTTGGIIGGPNSMCHKPSTLQGYYQSALLSILSYYLAAKKFVISHVSWTSATSQKTA